MDLRDVGSDAGDGIDLAQDKVQWQALCMDSNEPSGSLKAFKVSKRKQSLGAGSGL